MNPTLTQITAQSHMDDLLREATSQRQGVAITGRARRLFRRRRWAARHTPRVAVA
jgi:hypothetical protein